MSSHVHPTPKILPWLARQAGIDIRRAEALWHEAQRHAARASTSIATPAFWQIAMERLVDLLALERAREDAASFGWRNWARANAAYWNFRMRLLETCALSAERGWRVIERSVPGIETPSCA